MSWNVNKSSNRKGRIDDSIRVHSSLERRRSPPSKVRYGTDNTWLNRWKEELTDLGLGEIEHSCDWASERSESTVPPHSDIGHDNGHITAINTEWNLARHEPTIRESVEQSDRGFFDTHFPEKILITSLETPRR
jgi:hypothetical protein